MAASTSMNGEVGSKKAEMEKKVGNDTCNAAPQSGSQSDKIRDGSSCACECEKKVRDLEVTMNLISAWKDEVDRWMLSNFGFAVCISPVGADEKSPDVTNKKVEDPLAQNVEAVNGVGSAHNFEDEVEDNDLSFMNSEETENVEIMPEIFGHFLLGNDSEESDKSEVYDEALEEAEMDQHEQRPNRGKRRRLGDDSDSSCYTVSSSSSESMSSDDEDYRPTRGRGRGRPRGDGISRISPQKNASPSKNHKPGTSKTSASSNPIDKIDHASRMDLVKHIRKRPGNVWECNVCSFMLGDFNRMLLHIKYNHSTTTHRCSHCRAIVLCRSPKDAMIHEEQCKLRPVPSTSRCPPPAPVRKLITPTPKEVRTKKLPVSVDAKVDKFVSELLKPGPSKPRPSSIPSKNKGKKAAPLDIVTLSSDDED